MVVVNMLDRTERSRFSASPKTSSAATTSSGSFIAGLRERGSIRGHHYSEESSVRACGRFLRLSSEISHLVTGRAEPHRIERSQK